jgi:hypothetical protein
MCLLDMTRVCELKENISSYFFRYGGINTFNKTPGPRLTVHWNSDKRCAACRHAKLSEEWQDVAKTMSLLTAYQSGKQNILHEAFPRI